MKMWGTGFNRKSATISGWQSLGDFAAFKQQLQKIRASTRLPGRKQEQEVSSGRNKWLALMNSCASKQQKE